MSAGSPLTAAAAQYLRDGEWHPADSVLLEMQKVIHFGRAAKYATGRGRDTTRIARGRVELAKKKMYLLIRDGRFEVKEVDGVPHLRDVHAGYVSTADLAARLGRSTSSIHNWVTGPETFGQVQALCPTGVLPACLVRNVIRIPEQSLPAWEEFSGSRATARFTDTEGLLRIVGEVFELPPETAVKKFREFQRALRTLDYAIARKQLSGSKNKKAPPAGNDAEAPSQQGATD